VRSFELGLNSSHETPSDQFSNLDTEEVGGAFVRSSIQALNGFRASLDRTIQQEDD